jgi:hypothetical protein
VLFWEGHCFWYDHPYLFSIVKLEERMEFAYPHFVEGTFLREASRDDHVAEA